MPTSKAGASIKDLLSNKKGVTLLELLVVIVILGSIAAIVAPKFSAFEGFMLDSEARKVAGLLRYLDESATTKNVYYRVWFRPEEESFEVESSPDGVEFKRVKDNSLKGYKFRAGIDMEDIVVAGLGKVASGEAAVVFNPGAGAGPFALHLKKSGAGLTVSYNPYSGKVTIKQGYIGLT